MEECLKIYDASGECGEETETNEWLGGEKDFVGNEDYETEDAKKERSESPPAGPGVLNSALNESALHN